MIRLPLTKLALIVASIAITLSACNRYNICECDITRTNNATGDVAVEETTFHEDYTKNTNEGQLKCDKYDAVKTFMSRGDSVTEAMDCNYLGWGGGLGPPL